MKSQILNKAALRNLVLPAAMLLAFAGTALAQNNIQATGPNGLLQAKDAADQAAIKDYIKRRETDEEYQKTIHEQQSAKTSNDPWGSVRPTTTPTTPAVKPAAKPATKSASTTTKPAKPAVGSTPNGQ
jgi:hypothetical protein